MKRVRLAAIVSGGMAVFVLLVSFAYASSGGQAVARGRTPPEKTPRWRWSGLAPEDLAWLSPPPTATPSPQPTPPASASVPILMYHYISDLPADADRYRHNLTVVPADFEAQLQYLAQAGFHTITLNRLYRHLFTGLPLPEKPIVLTFDDGYRDAYEVAFPLLQRYDSIGTFFVLATPAHFENAQYLTWNMMAEMSDAGMEMQAHGRDHYDLRSRPYDFLVYQILGAREAVEAHTGRPVRFFCYPSGQYDDDVVAVVRSAGYLGAVTTEWGRVHTRENIYTLSRLRVPGNIALEDYIALVEE